MRLLSFGDVQICPKSYLEIDKLFKEAIKIIQQEKIELVVFPGDLFEFSNYTNTFIPPSQIIEPYINFFNKICDEQNLEVFIIAGNHDKTYGSFVDAVSIFKRANIKVISDKVSLEEYGEVGIIAVPWLMQYEFEDQYISKDGVLKEIVAQKKEAEAAGLFPLLVGHMRIDSAYFKNNKAKSETSFEFTVNEIASLGIEYGILGDIHNYQNVVNKIDYMGSSRQRNFGESGNPTKLRILGIDDTGVYEDKYIDLTHIMPQYITRSAKDEQELIEIINSFTKENDGNQYRVSIDFNTIYKSPYKNLFIKHISKQNKTNTAITQHIGTKITPELLFSVYNDKFNQFTNDELVDIVDFFKKNK